MGNSPSCAAPNVSKLSVKVVLPNGKLEEYRRAVTVGELMKENPSHYVCHSLALISMKRDSMLAGETELEPGRLYYVLPNAKFQRVLKSESDAVVGSEPVRPVNAIESLGQAKFEIQHSGNSPATLTKVTIKGDDLEALFPEVDGPGRKQSPLISYSSPDLRSLYINQAMLTRSNSWKPQLETIQEVVAMSRSKKQRVHNWEESIDIEALPGTPVDVVQVSKKTSRFFRKLIVADKGTKKLEKEPSRFRRQLSFFSLNHSKRAVAAS